MICPECQHDRVMTYDTRKVSFNYVVRKRKCRHCDHRFYTVEGYMSQEEFDEITALRKGKHHDEIYSGDVAEDGGQAA
jgi:transcriptional regulator NrdR family protein